MVAPALIGGLIGAGYGALSYKSDKAAADRQRQMQAIIESQSPWTHMHGRTDTPDPSLLGNVEGGALTGMTFGAKNFLNKGGGTADSPEQETPQQMPQSGTEQQNLAGDAPAGGVASNTQAPNYVDQSSMNPATKAYDYSNPNAVGYSPWNDLNVNPNKRAPYIPPGTEAQAQAQTRTAKRHMSSPWVNPNYA